MGLVEMNAVREHIPNAVIDAARELEGYDLPASVASVADCATDLLCEWTVYLTDAELSEIYAEVQGYVLCVFERVADSDDIELDELARFSTKGD